MTQPTDPVLLPYDEQAEKRVLGSVLLSPRALEDARRILGPADFHLTTVGQWFAEALHMRDQGDPVEPDLLASRLNLNTEDRSRLHEIIATTHATANVAHYAQIVYQDARRRELITAAQELQKAARNGGIAEHPELVERLRDALDGGHRGRSASPLDLTELLAGDPPTTDWLWHQWIAWEDLCLIVGDPKTGKSLLALGLAVAARDGGWFLGEEVAQARVGIFDLENPLSEVHKRLRRIGLTHTDHDGIHYFHTPAMNLATIDGVAQLAATIEEHNLEVIIIDSFRRSAPGIDENDSAAISAFFAPLRRLTAGQRRVIIVIHHARKRTGADTDTEASQMTRGSGDFLAAVDTQLYLKKKGPGKFHLEHGAARRGIGHDTIAVNVSNAEDAALTFTNEGTASTAESKLDEWLIKIIHHLKEQGGGPFTTTRLLLDLDVAPNQQRTFRNALKLGYETNKLGRTENPKANQPDEWALAETEWS